MRAIQITQPGAPDVLQVCQRDMPSCRPGEVLIRVHAAGVNRPDVLQRTGNYPVPAGASDIPGLEIAGEVIDGDFSDSHLKKGDMVCALVQGGGYAEYCTAPAALCLPLPQGWSALEAASMVETLFTVWSNVFDRGRLSGDETLLVQGGSSGIGVTAIQLAHARGHRVFATAGSAEKCAACLELGAERAIHYKDEDFGAVVKSLTMGKGVDVILDMVGGDYIPRELDALAEDGRLVFIAMLGGPKAQVNFGKVLLKRLTITGSTLRARPVAFKTAIAAQLQEQVWPLLEKRRIKPVIYQTFPFEQAAQAHALMESGSHIGKIMLTFASAR
jgi:NADPH2:quinone reductase